MPKSNEYGEIIREGAERDSSTTNKVRGERGFIGLAEIAEESGLTGWVRRHPDLNLKEALKLELLQIQKEQIEHEMKRDGNDRYRKLLEKIGQEIQVLFELERSSEEQEAVHLFREAVEMFDEKKQGVA